MTFLADPTKASSPLLPPLFKARTINSRLERSSFSCHLLRTAFETNKYLVGRFDHFWTGHDLGTFCGDFGVRE
jgi:hypothetical protein